MGWETMKNNKYLNSIASDLVKRYIPKSKLENCLLILRDGEDVLFNQTRFGIFSNLDGYAIIPIEKYEELTRDNEK